MYKRLTQLELLKEFSENAIKKIINKFLNDASESDIRKELIDFERYKNAIQLKDPFQYKTWIDFTEAIHGAKGKSEFKKRNLKDKNDPKKFVNKSEESSDAIVDDQEVTIFKGDSEHKCVKYGTERGKSIKLKTESNHAKSKKYSQKDLISESFWDGFKPQNWGKVARGSLKVAGDVLRTVAPELTDPIDKLDNKLHNYKNSFKRGYGGIPDPERERSDTRSGVTGEVAQSVSTGIKLGLAARGVTLIPRFGIQPNGIDPNNGNKLYKLKAKTARHLNGEWMLVDGRGNSS